VGVRSIGTLENLCTLSQNEPAVSYLRELAKSFGRSDSSLHGVPESRVRGNATLPHANAGDDARNDANDATISEKEDDSVRFSARVQSKLFDATASPSTISGGAADPPGRRRGGDRAKRESSGSGPGKKSKLSRRSVSRSASGIAKHLSDRSGDVPTLPLEAPRPKNSAPSTVSPMVQLQPNAKNVDKIRRRSKKGSSTPKRADAK